ncbi:MAG: ATP-binding cassette domain-containing protein [Gemmatimonadetes bacterium]|nr:ATP-binding cassette domain-containing protein [Gemmatimonadota bacterium]
MSGPAHPDVAPLVRARDLQRHFPVGGGLFRAPTGAIRAVDGVSLDIARGETLALVGESGSGKTTTGRLILHLDVPTGGTVHFDGTDLASLAPAPLRAMRRRMQLVFQDPFGSLNPRMTIGDTVKEGLLIHRLAEGAEADRRTRALLEEVGLRADWANRYPHEFSGGQRQRVGIARALSVGPDFVVLDEPVSALDVSVQAQVINLLMDLQKQRGLTYLFIAHDLSVVEHVADRVAVMYLGRIVELAPRDAIFAEPLHPYAQALRSAVPVADPTVRARRIVLAGEPPSPADPPTGCPFHPRCHHPARDESCARLVPPLEEKAPAHLVACHKQPPTTITWEAQQVAGATRQPERHLPVLALDARTD